MAYCNAISTSKNLDPCYTCTGEGRSVNCLVNPKYGGSKIYSCPGYRFPTEAEWEYAYRAGTTTALYNGPLLGCQGPDANANTIAWFDGNSGLEVHPVGLKEPNALGLFDMAGNAFEFCHDRFQNDLTSTPVVDPAGPVNDPKDPRVVIRGGTASSSVLFLRAAAREDLDGFSSASETVSFRCARTLP